MDLVETFSEGPITDLRYMYMYTKNLIFCPNDDDDNNNNDNNVLLLTYNNNNDDNNTITINFNNKIISIIKMLIIKYLYQ